jgi:hypothetical protein
MIQETRWASILLGMLFLIPANVMAQDAPEREFNRRQFSGWDGIMFTCYSQKDASWTKDLCKQIVEDARFLSSSAGIPISSCVDCNSFQRFYQAGELMKHGLELSVEIMSTTETPYGGAIIVQAANFYSDAVELGAVGENNPEAIPKAGDLGLWRRHLSFSGYSSAGTDLKSYVETILKQFFSDFIQARSSKKAE